MKTLTLAALIGETIEETSNGLFITERNFGPLGTTGVNLLIFDQKQLIQRIESLKLTVKSYNNEIRNVC